MTLEQRTLLALLKSNLTGTTPLLPFGYEGVDWSAVHKEALQQSVYLMSYDALASSEDISEEIKTLWKPYAQRIIFSNTRANYAQSKLVSLLDAEGLPYVILKGEAASAYYAKPELRSLGDVDFLVAPSDVQRIRELLVAEGFACSHEGHACHLVFRKPDAHLEMHFEVAGIPDTPVGDQIRQWMQSALEKKQLAQNMIGSFLVPSDFHHGMILALHMQHHMLGEGLGLRHLSDWAAYVQKTEGADFWEADLLPKLSQCGLLEFASTMTATCARYLGIQCPDWAQNVPSELCELIIEDILQGGNFGRKDADRARSGMLISNEKKASMGKGKLYYMFHTLVDSIKEQHPHVKKWPILYGVHFVYRIIRYLVLLIIGKRPGFGKLLKAAEEREDVYKRLHIFEVN